MTKADNKSTRDKTTPKANTGAGSRENAGPGFAVAALDMSWRLAVVVLLPIYGGYNLDKYFDILPVLTVVGLLVALVGSMLVIKKQLDMIGPSFGPGGKK